MKGKPAVIEALGEVLTAELTAIINYHTTGEFDAFGGVVGQLEGVARRAVQLVRNLADYLGNRPIIVTSNWPFE